MIPSNVEIRSRARQTLLCHYGTMVAAMVTAEVIVWLLSSFSSFSGKSGFFVIISFLFSLLVSILTNVLHGGFDYLCLQLVRERQVRFTDLFFCFRVHAEDFIRLACGIALVNLIVALPFGLILLFLSRMGAGTSSGMRVIRIVVIIIYILVLLLVNILYSMSFLILIDEQKLGPVGAMRAGRAFAQQAPEKLLMLYLSFAGYILLGILSFGIGFLWVMPYIGTSKAHYYLAMREVDKNRQQE